ncbi:MAG: hypothetical protein K6G54_05420 [Oscillospiraceae bacterium]|nr:hypothetical protein [Oscillospiraceae bacterium]
MPYTMFSSAVVSLDRDLPDRDYQIFPWYGYACRNGTWYRTRLDRSPAKNRKLGELVRDVDAILRERYGFDAPLKQTDKTKLFTGIVNSAVDAVQEEKRRKAAAVIHIDVDKLNAIRSDASATREKLMTDEERDDESGAEADRRCLCAEEGGLLTGGNKEYRDALQASETTIFPTCQESVENAECGMRNAECGISSAAATEADGLPLDETETAVLRAILTGGDCGGAAKTGGKMLSVVIDEINEKLFDEFGDTVLYDAGDGPAVYEDYAEELKERIGS